MARSHTGAGRRVASPRVFYPWALGPHPQRLLPELTLTLSTRACALGFGVSLEAAWALHIIASKPSRKKSVQERAGFWQRHCIGGRCRWLDAVPRVIAGSSNAVR